MQVCIAHGVQSLPLGAQEEAEAMSFSQTLAAAEHKRQFSKILGQFEGKCRRKNRITD